MGVVVNAIGYDNACQLKAFAERVRERMPPWTDSMADSVAFILDRFHSRNHARCLTHRPSVDPQNPINGQYLEGKNTAACEQLNS